MSVTLYYLLTVSTLHQSALLEILPMSSITKTKILPTMTECKLRITSNWSREKKNGYCRVNTIYYLKRVDVRTKRSMALAREKRSGSWLTALPIKSLGYTLNKREFQDSICLKYEWRIPNTPSYCLCGVKNDIDHALSCKKGGYVLMRHNRIREVCSDVRIGPELMPLGNNLMRNGNNAENARLDVSERTFLDIRVMHPNAPSYVDKSIDQVYTPLEKEKKRAYNERMTQMERAHSLLS